MAKSDNSYEIPEIERLLETAKLSPTASASAFAAIEALRQQADRYERDLVRMLRWDDDGNVRRTWAEVAELLGAQLGSRQAAHARWRRLVSPDRRTTTGDYRRGHARM